MGSGRREESVIWEFPKIRAPIKTQMALPKRLKSFSKPQTPKHLRASSAVMSLTSQAFVLPQQVPGAARQGSLRGVSHPGAARSTAHEHGAAGGLPVTGAVLAAAALRRACRGAAAPRRAEKGTTMTVVGVDSEDPETLAPGLLMQRSCRKA